MKTVRISLKAARLIVDAFAEHVPPGVCCRYGHGELESAIAKAQRTTSKLTRLAKPKKAAKASKREETAAIWEAVMERAEGRCEFCRNVRELDLDHFFGRGKVRQSIENCWALCRQCHREKTANIPTAEAWYSDFTIHCDTHGYSAERRRAFARLQFLETRAALKVAP